VHSTLPRVAGECEGGRVHNCACGALMLVVARTSRCIGCVGERALSFVDVCARNVANAERCGHVRPTLHAKLCGRGLRADADAARRLPRSTPEEAKRDLQPACRRDSRELTSRPGRRAEAGPHQLLRGVGLPPCSMGRLSRTMIEGGRRMARIYTETIPNTDTSILRVVGKVTIGSGDAALRDAVAAALNSNGLQLRRIRGGLGSMIAFSHRVRVVTM